MSILRITGGTRLAGEVRVHGAKNSVLPIMAASLLSAGETVIHNCPGLSDVEAAMKILRHLGCRAEKDGDAVFIDSAPMCRCDIPDALMREMRSSVIFLGAILARCGEAHLSMPGGCELGPRPIDLHLGALRTLGAETEESGGGIVCRGTEMTGKRIVFPVSSVGATENAMIAAAGCRGRTVITNAAREPEIGDLARFLQKIGVGVTGAGTAEIAVEGAKPGGGRTEHAVIPDRIVAATFLAAAAATGGRIRLTGVVPAHFAAVSDTLAGMGCAIAVEKDAVTIAAERGLRAAQPVITRPYPGFPTDAQPPVMAASLKAAGTTFFVETIFKERFRHVGELVRMGADIRTEGSLAVVNGVQRLHAAPVAATDLRGGAALAVAALSAEGTTEISGLWHIDRGYDSLEARLSRLGAKIERIP